MQPVQFPRLNPAICVMTESSELISSLENKAGPATTDRCLHAWGPGAEPPGACPPQALGSLGSHGGHPRPGSPRLSPAAAPAPPTASFGHHPSSSLGPGPSAGPQAPSGSGPFLPSSSHHQPQALPLPWGLCTGRAAHTPPSSHPPLQKGRRCLLGTPPPRSVSADQSLPNPVTFSPRPPPRPPRAAPQRCHVPLHCLPSTPSSLHTATPVHPQMTSPAPQEGQTPARCPRNCTSPRLWPHLLSFNWLHPQGVPPLGLRLGGTCGPLSRGAAASGQPRPCCSWSWWGMQAPDFPAAGGTGACQWAFAPTLRPGPLCLPLPPSLPRLVAPGRQ